MTRHQRLRGLLRQAAVPALALLALPQPANCQSSAAPAQVRPLQVRYLANEGVLLEGSGGRVLIDALFGDGLPEYPTVPAGMRDSLERAVGPYGGRAIVLITHAHRDHFDSAAVERYRRHNPAAVVVGPPSVGATPPPVDLGWVKVKPLNIQHAGTRPTGHAAYLVTLDGTTVLHLGDTDSDPATWRAAGVPEEGVDLALVPFWYALAEGRLEAAMAVLRAGRWCCFTPRSSGRGADGPR